MAAAWLTGEVTVTTTAGPIPTNAQIAGLRLHKLIVRNPVGGTTVTLGGSAVAAGTGYDLVAGAEVSFDLDNTDLAGEPLPQIYADIASGSQAVEWLALVT